jgi:lambda repressor-like predicted transcriptional regulator
LGSHFRDFHAHIPTERGKGKGDAIMHKPPCESEPLETAKRSTSSGPPNKAIKSKKHVEIILLTALAKGATVAQAARQAGVSERTVFRRRQQPEFQARIDAIQDETLQRVADLITKAAQEGIHSLVALQDQATPPSVRRAAARDILDLGPRLRQDANLEKRLAALENKVAGANGASIPAGRPPAGPSGKRRRRGDTIVQAALAGGDTIAQAASKAQLSERTVYRRLKEPTFKRCIEDLRAEMVQRAAALLIAAALLATKTLIDLQNPSVPASVRRRASRDIIELGRKLREMTILEKRLAALETQYLPLDT